MSTVFYIIKTQIVEKIIYKQILDFTIKVHMHIFFK